MAMEVDVSKDEVWANDVLKAAFRSQHVTVTQSLNAKDVMPYMFAERLLDANDIAQLEAITGQTHQCGKFLIRLHMSGHPETFVKLLKALKKSDVDLGFIVTLITEECKRIVAHRHNGDQPVQRQQALDERTTFRSLHALTRNTTPVWAVATLDENLYVAYGNSVITVYDKYKVVEKNHLAVPGLGKVWDLAPCKQFHYFYIADRANEVVHKVDKDGGKLLQWSVKDLPHGLSVTAAYNVLVTCDKAGKIKEYTEFGDIRREMKLPADQIPHPTHTVQLAPDSYVVCNGYGIDSLRRVCVVNGGGEILQWFGGSSGSDNNHMCSPYRLSVVNGYILVADARNGRVLQLNDGLRFVRKLVSGLRGYAYGMWFDDETNRLYVSVNNRSFLTWNRGQISVFGM